MNALARRRRGRGFTLVELLVAISILAIVAVLGWRGLDGVVRARVTLTRQIEDTRGMQLAFAQMQSDTEHLTDTSVLQGRPNLLSANDSLILVRNVYRENEPARVQVVSYRVFEGVLQRRESVATRDLMQLDTMWAAVTSGADTTPPVALQSNVVSMTTQTFNGTGWGAPAMVVGQGQGQGQVNPGAPVAAPVISTPAGLQVALQLKDKPAAMIKSFLLTPR